MGGMGGMGEAEAERRSEAEHALQAGNSGTSSFLADGGGAQPGANARRRRSVRLPNVEAVRASVQYSVFRGRRRERGRDGLMDWVEGEGVSLSK